MSRVRERSTSLTQPLLEAALERGFTVRSPHDPAERGGSRDHRPGRQRPGARRAARPRRGRGPPAGGRHPVSPHFYNTLDEALGVLDAMTEVLSGR
jgi:hypothetical protein